MKTTPPECGGGWSRSGCVTHVRFIFFLLLADLEKDGFRYKSEFQKWIKSKDNKFLILNESAELQCSDLSIQEQEYYSGESRATPNTTLPFVTVVLAHKDQVLALKELDFQDSSLHSATISKVAVKKQHFGTSRHGEHQRLWNSLQNTNFTSAFTRTRTRWGGWGWFCTPAKTRRRWWCAATTCGKFTPWKWWVEANGSGGLAPAGVYFEERVSRGRGSFKSPLKCVWGHGLLTPPANMRSLSQDISRDIAANADKALFYLMRISKDRYLLESSLHPSMFLAFEPDSSNQTLNKVILRHKESDEVNESCHVIMS